MTGAAQLNGATGAALSPPRRRVLVVLSLLMGFASISTDLYLPAMPAIARALGTSAGTLAYTVSGYLVGFSVGQLAWGPLGDRHGRRAPVAIGLVMFVVGSAGCALASGIGVMIAWRIVQAAGASASVVLARAMVRDLYQGHDSARMLSTLLTVMMIAPLVGPIAGGWITTWLGWRAVFWTLVAIGLATLAALYSIPETLPAHLRRHEPLKHAFRQYGGLLWHRRTLGYAGAGGFMYGACYAYVASGPFAFITYHHVPAQHFGWLFGAVILGMMATNQLNVRAVPVLGPLGMLRRGTWAAAAFGLVLAFAAYTSLLGLWGLYVPLFLFISCTGFIIANSIAGALEDFPRQAGAVSALVGALQYGCGIASSALVGALADGTPWPMGLVMGACGLGCLACATRVIPPTRKVSATAC